MYYEEKWIESDLYWRGTPDGDWVLMSRKQLLEKLAHAAEYKERVEALEALLVCYRLGKQPSEALHQKLAKTKKALEHQQ